MVAVGRVGGPAGAKERRRALLAELIETGRFRTQDELAEELARHGEPATPATISRDLKELGYVKTVGGAYARQNGTSSARSTAGAAGPSSETLLRRLLTDLPLDIEQAMNLMVLRTLPGYAHSVAAGIDACHWPEVAGTVAGDDTIFVALRDLGQGDAFRRRLLALAQPLLVGGPANGR